MIAVPQLTVEEFSRPRSAVELRDWAIRVVDSLGATREGRTALRLETDPLIKSFKREAWPLASFASLLFSKRRDVLFRLLLGGSADDAQILGCKSGDILHRVQITLALDGDAGYQERLRMEHLVQHGRAPATGATLRRSPDRSVPEAFSDVVNHDEARAEELRRIERAIERKAAKSYGAGTLLLVEFSHLHFAFEEDHEALAQFARALANAWPIGPLALVDDWARVGVRLPPLELATATA